MVPAALAGATELRLAGVERVVVLERETQAGDVPRHCGHPPFGMREFRRILTGPNYARRIVKRAEDAGIEIRTRQSVVSLEPSGLLQVVTPNGTARVKARLGHWRSGNPAFRTPYRWQPAPGGHQYRNLAKLCLS